MGIAVVQVDVRTSSELELYDPVRWFVNDASHVHAKRTARSVALRLLLVCIASVHIRNLQDDSSRDESNRLETIRRQIDILPEK